MANSKVAAIVALLTHYAQAQSSRDIPGQASYVAPYGYPTTAFSSYYPVASGQEPQPALFDPVLNITYPLNLTNPDSLPDDDPDPIYFPSATADLSVAAQKNVISDVLKEVGDIVGSSNYSSSCSKCQAALSAAKRAAQLAPELVPEALVKFCITTGYGDETTCEQDFKASTYGAVWTQVLALSNPSGLDGEYICNHLDLTFCPYPAVTPLDPNEWFPKPKPADAADRVPKPSGQKIKVVHMSDFHLDPRYKVGSEGNCTTDLCCRSDAENEDIMSDQISYPAPLYGAFACDTPYDLGLAALQAVGPLTGTNNNNPLAFTIYTGDLVSHEPQTQLSRLYTEYAEYSVYYMFSRYLTGPVFPVLGNHDTNPDAINAPHSLPGPLGEQISWNFEHVSKLWRQHGWIDAAAAKEARVHYGGYSIKNHYGLRIITFNTDFWYHSNYLNFINTTNPDVSGTFKFMIDELQAAEDAGERVWIIGHVLSGWDGTNPIANPTDLFYQIVNRYSPHVIANVFFGHTHEDQFMIYYANNGTVQSLDTALTPGWIGPSVTPLTNLNSGFRMYEIDSSTFDVYEAYTWYADVNAFSSLDGGSHGPAFRFEYSTREEYGAVANWPEDAPLNATFWHAVTEAMQEDISLVSKFNTYQGKRSVMTPNCTDQACAAAKICYMRSGSTALGLQCPYGYGSVQAPFEPN